MGYGGWSDRVSRYLGDAETGAAQGQQASELEVTDARTVGSTWLLDALWRRLGIADALEGLLAGLPQQWGALGC